MCAVVGQAGARGNGGRGKPSGFPVTDLLRALANLAWSTTASESSKTASAASSVLRLSTSTSGAEVGGGGSAPSAGSLPEVTTSQHVRCCKQ